MTNLKVSGLLSMSNFAHASSTKEHEDNDDYHGKFRRSAEQNFEIGTWIIKVRSADSNFITA